MNKTRGQNYEKMLERAEILCKLQKEMHPLVPTFRDMAEAWGVSSTNTVEFALRKMLKSGLVERYKRGKKSYWWAK